MHASVGKYHLKFGYPTDAEKTYRTGVELLEALVDAHDDRLEYQCDLSLAYLRLSNVLRILDKKTEADATLQKSIAAAKKLRQNVAEGNSSHHEWAMSAFHELGDSLRRQGNLDAAQAQYEAGLAVSKSLLQSAPDNISFQQNPTIFLDKIGDLLLHSGQLQEAKSRFNESLKIRDALANSNPNDRRSLRDLAVSHDKIGDVLLQAGKPNEARSRFEKCLQILKPLADSASDDLRLQRDHSIANAKMGMALIRLNKSEEAMSKFQSSLEIFQKIVDADSNEQSLRDLSEMHEKIAALHLQAGHGKRALTQLQKGLKFKSILARHNPNDVPTWIKLAGAHDQIGELLLQLNNAPEAEHHFRRSLEAFEDIAALYPRDFKHQRNLSVAHDRMSRVLLENANPQQAEIHLRTSLKIFQALVESNPKNRQLNQDLAKSYGRLGRFLFLQDRFPAAVKHHQFAVDALEKMVASDLADGQTEASLKLAKQLLKEAKLASVVLGDWSQLLTADQDELCRLLEIRAIELSGKRARFDEAAQAAERLQSLKNASAANLFNSAAVLGLCAGSIKGITQQADRTKRRAWQKASLAALKKSIALGWNDIDSIAGNKAFHSLRELPEYRRIIERLKSQ